ncbi:MAG: methionyl-tRNA formyltransferase [Candidatus Peribacteraceae bacterium]
MPSPVTIIFCGTPTFAVPSLQALIDDDAFSVELVITQPDKPVGRKQVLTAPPVKAQAEQHGIPVVQPENTNDLENEIPACDFLVTVAYGQMIGPALLALPSIAPVNVHPSLLPRWRGASPIQHAILKDDRETGVTIQQMVEELDAGPILAQEHTEIDPRETAESLHERLSVMSAELLLKTLKHPLSPKEQDETGVTFCKKLTRKDSIVDPAQMTAEEIDRHVRALVPWPGVLCTMEGEELKLLETSLESQEDALLLPCKNASNLYVMQLQPPGKKPMTGTEWKRGRR